MPKALLAADAQGIVPPVTTKGDLYTYDGSAVARQAVGTEGQVLVSRAAAPNGLAWEAPATPTLPVGTVIWSASPTVPTQYLEADGSTKSRATYSALFAAIRLQLTVTTNSNAILTGIASTARLYPGMPVEGSGIPAGSYILTVDSATQVTLNQNTTASATITATFFPWGNGDGSTTFHLPNLPGRKPVAVGTGIQALTIVAVDTGTEVLTITPNKSLITGQAVVYSTSGTAIGGLTNGNTYYVIRETGNDRSVKLASSLANAVAGTAINLTSAGSGTQLLTATLSARPPGELRGEETHAQTVAELAAHTHGQSFASGGSDGASGSGNKRDTGPSTGGGAAFNVLNPEIGLFAYVYAGA